MQNFFFNSALQNCSKIYVLTRNLNFNSTSSIKAVDFSPLCLSEGKYLHSRYFVG